MISWSIVGHEKQKQWIEQALKGDRLSHAYLLNGPERIGKTSFALDFARALMCMGKSARQIPCGKCQSCLLKTANHPDLFLIDQNTPIPIEQIRSIQAKFALRSYTGGFKVAIASRAENFTRDAANAFLKFLEEPHDRTLFFLCSARLSAIPATIISRVQIIRFSYATAGDYRKFLKDNPKSSKLLEKFSTIASLRLGLANNLAQMPEQAQVWEAAKNSLDKFVQFSDTEGFLENWSLAELERDQLKELLDRWIMIISSDYLITATSQEKIIKILDAIIDAQNMLAQNLNGRLVLDNLFIKTQNLTNIA